MARKALLFDPDWRTTPCREAHGEALAAGSFARRGLLRLLPGTKRRAEALNGALSAGLHKRELRPRKSEGDGACGCGDPSRSMRPRRVSSEDPGALVIEPTGPHTHTVVLLHGMYTAPEDSDTMMELPQSVARVGLPGCKYANVASWYNYYTRRDGEHQHDAHLASQTRRIHSILDREIELLGGDAQRVMLGGCSQGGTGFHVEWHVERDLTVVASWVARAARQREMRERERSASPELILEQEYLDYW
ncbi:hypothetical protein EMIHUDRAFT_195180 [Emiliania huxleyi CCMP1516]|uniref:Phospholipase/carboxylesterase/thioesterase domain-containing protein n=2 Tax=Emiliania huxleyi TaxID=2903 RepID=A0A0D3JH20_EMIH1|nr:hypothetical protein EMIHUDRAFT_195180 [Emiliania huxleyi CCMP1516]EOD22805.1 hypothetical protein EMIHUDRAFT_195180 [Emiliania huxleyi CCMP1516]|eukprot:XP_005775234.1 hypothetical protein EMIHUDRAFT_195180 [Emiliania huxleyi CCMP1516]